ncbi:MAG: type II toxin-antitoxin system VapB family antitoxin [Stenotrophobium sp.]
MRTNIFLDDQLVAEAMKLAGVSTKRETINVALRNFVTTHRQRRILDLAGQGYIDPDYDVRTVRKDMNRGPG